MFNIVLYFAFNILGVLCQYNTINVKTVLFKESDLSKNCWYASEINLLAARKVFQNLIPTLVPRNIPLLIKYFQKTEETVLKFTYPGNQRTVLLFALSDVIGGYLQSIAIPIAKESFYAGNTNYDSVNQLLMLLHDIKIKLGTDGGQWSRTIALNKIPTKVVSLELDLKNPDEACGHLAMSNCSSIPYLDDNVIPSAVAIPLRTQNLFSLMRPGSSHILVRYYMLVMQCLSNSTSEEILLFNHIFHEWIITKVVPHLYDSERWYPGFGSVMRIVETMDQRGLSSIAKYQRKLTVHDSSLEESLNNSTSCGIAGLYNFFESPFFLGSILLLTLILLLLCFCLCCCWCVTKKQKQYYSYFENNGKDSGVLNAVLSVYCGLKDYKGLQTNEIYVSNNHSMNYPRDITTSETLETEESSELSEDELHY